MFANNILPDLNVPVNDAVHPIIKVDAIKYVITFRSKLTGIGNIMPILMNHLTSDNYVVYTYAAICIEKILSTKLGDTFM